MLYTVSGIPGSFLGAYLIETSWGRIKTLAFSTLATAFGELVFVLVDSQTGVVLSSMLVSLAATLMCESIVISRLERSPQADDLSLSSQTRSCEFTMVSCAVMLGF